jgi:hypothetical protein
VSDIRGAVLVATEAAVIPNHESGGSPDPAVISVAAGLFSITRPTAPHPRFFTLRTHAAGLLQQHDGSSWDRSQSADQPRIPTRSQDWTPATPWLVYNATRSPELLSRFRGYDTCRHNHFVAPWCLVHSICGWAAPCVVSGSPAPARCAANRKGSKMQGRRQTLHFVLVSKRETLRSRGPSLTRWRHGDCPDRTSTMKAPYPTSLTASVAGDLPRVSRAISTVPREAARTRRACGIGTP